MNGRRIAVAVLAAVGVFGALAANAAADPTSPTDPTSPISSAAPTAARPDFSVTAYGFAGVGRGTGANISFNIENNSAVAASTGELTLTIPAGLSLGAEGVTQNDGGTPACGRVRQSKIVCKLSGLPASGPELMSVDVEAAPTLRVGSRPTIIATFTPTQGDQKPADNTARLGVTVLPTAHLRVSVSMSSTRLTVGTAATGTLTVIDVGPDPAQGVMVGVGVPSDPNRITVRPERGDRSARQSGAEAVRFRLGTLRVGQRVTRSVLITGLVRSTPPFDAFVASASSRTVDPRPQCSTRSCSSAAYVHFTVGPRVVHPAPARRSAPRPHARAQNRLANTGAPVAALGTTGSALVLFGVWLCLAGRRRRLARHRAH